MSEFSRARRLLEAIGPGYLLLVGPDSEGLAIELRRLGCDVTIARREEGLAGALVSAAQPVDAVLWSMAAGATVPSPADLVAQVGSTPRVLALRRPSAQAAPSATDVQRDALANGWRRALCDWTVQRYREHDQPEAWSELYFEPLPIAPGASPLPPGRVDPTRSTGAAADAWLARHALAAEMVRPGDQVLVVGSGCGAGAALIAQRSRCAGVLGLDASAAAVAYARQHFGWPGLLSFETAAAQRMSPVADASVDLVVAIDAFDNCPDAEAVAAEFARVLKPDGRVVASASDGPAQGALRGDALQDLLGRRLLVEMRHWQPMPDDRGTLRTIDRVGLGDAMPAGGWRIIVAASNPMQPKTPRFVHPEFARLDGPPVPVTDFGAHYDNPWLYRPLVQMGQRLQDEALLTDLALEVLAQAPGDCADMGAALCVLAYQVLGRRRADQVENLLPLIDAYAAQGTTNPHVTRWQISLEFAAALACLTTGDAQRAQGYLERVTQRDPLRFSPLLSTKTIAASFWLGIRGLVGRQPDAARRWFESGVRAAARALDAPIEASIGSLVRPNTFGFQELAEVADMASQCAQALDALEHFDAAPGRFWRQVDTRRFGLATWLLNLERENAALRRQLQAKAV